MIIRQEQTRLALPKIDKRFKGIFYADDVSRGQNAIIITMSIVALRRMKGVLCMVEKFQIFPPLELVSHPIRKGSFLPFLVVSSLMRHLSIIVVELSQLLVLSLSESHDATTPLKVSEIGLLVGAEPSLNHRHLRPKFDLIIKWMACIFLGDCMITAIVKEMHNIKTRDIINKVALQKNHQHH